MSEERLEIIKENVYMRSEIAKNSRLGIDTSLGEELELLKEIDRLNNRIDELERWLKEDLKNNYRDAGYRHNLIIEVLDKLKELKDSD